MKILYMGFNSFKDHKRGPENVIEFQSNSFEFERMYYIHWGAKTTAYKNARFTCVSIKHCWYWPVILNFIMFRLCFGRAILIHSHNALFSIMSFFNTDLFTVHDALFYQFTANRHKLRYLFYFVERILYQRINKVHFISEYTKKQSLFPFNRDCVIIPNTSHFENPKYKKPSSIDLPANKIILTVRSIEERARCDLLLKLALAFRDESYFFLVAGKGPLLEYYRKEVIRLGIENLIFLGYVTDEDLISLYIKCEFVLIPSEYGEGFGIPIIEGYFFNKPVIASNKCAIPDIIINDKYLFENNVDSIIDRIKYLRCVAPVDFRGYYDGKYSNLVVFSQFRMLYASLM